MVENSVDAMVGLLVAFLGFEKVYWMVVMMVKTTVGMTVRLKVAGRAELTARLRADKKVVDLD